MQRRSFNLGLRLLSFSWIISCVTRKQNGKPYLLWSKTTITCKKNKKIGNFCPAYSEKGYFIRYNFID